MSQLSSRHSGSLFKPKKHNVSKPERNTEKLSADLSRTEFESICENSLREAIKNCDKLTLADFQKLGVTQNNKIFARQRSRSAPTSKEDVADKIDPWHVSYVSGYSFEQNKNESKVDKILKDVINTPSLYVDTSRGYKNAKISYSQNFASYLSQNLCTPKFKYEIQVRGFKTERTVISELERNPSVMQRFKKTMGEYQLYYF